MVGKFILFKRKGFWIILFFSLVVFGLSAGLVYYYQHYRQLLQNPGEASSREVESITKQISSFMELPTETPTLATVTDVSALSDQPFFANAQNGDKILVYSTDRKVILYRPSSRKVMNFAPLNIGNEGAEQTQSQKTTPITVAIYNGSTVSGLSSEIESTLSKIAGFSVVTKNNAKKSEYQESLVVDLSGKNPESASKIASIIGGSVAAMPEGEVKPDADILIIAGVTASR